jgi:hypothetical protein
MTRGPTECFFCGQAGHFKRHCATLGRLIQEGIVHENPYNGRIHVGPLVDQGPELHAIPGYTMLQTVESLKESQFNQRVSSQAAELVKPSAPSATRPVAPVVASSSKPPASASSSSLARGNTPVSTGPADVRFIRLEEEYSTDEEVQDSREEGLYREKGFVSRVYNVRESDETDASVLAAGETSRRTSPRRSPIESPKIDEQRRASKSKGKGKALPTASLPREGLYNPSIHGTPRFAPAEPVPRETLIEDSDSSSDSNMQLDEETPSRQVKWSTPLESGPTGTTSSTPVPTSASSSTRRSEQDSSTEKKKRIRKPKAIDYVKMRYNEEKLFERIMNSTQTLSLVEVFGTSPTIRRLFFNNIEKLGEEFTARVHRTGNSTITEADVSLILAKDSPFPTKLVANIQKLSAEQKIESPWLIVALQGQDPICALVDTGAEICLISERYAHKLGIPFSPAPRMRINSATGHQQTLVGYARDVHVRAGPFVYLVPFYIISTDSYDLLLGNPFIDRARMLVGREEGRWVGWMYSEEGDQYQKVICEAPREDLND